MLPRFVNLNSRFPDKEFLLKRSLLERSGTDLTQQKNISKANSSFYVFSVSGERSGLVSSRLTCLPDPSTCLPKLDRRPAGSRPRDVLPNLSPKLSPSLSPNSRFSPSSHPSYAFEYGSSQSSLESLLSSWTMRDIRFQASSMPTRNRVTKPRNPIR